MQAATAQPTLAAPSPDWRRVARRFFWKERRRLTGIAIAVAVGAALLMLLGNYAATPQSAASGRLTIAFGAACLLAVAAAVTVFSVEHEENTVPLLRVLPRERLALVAGKLAGAAAVVLVTLVVLTLLAVAPGNRVPYAGAIAGQGMVFLAEAFVFGLLASLLVRQPLLAAVLGIAAASMASQLAIAVWVPSAHGFTLGDFQAASPLRLLIVALVGAADVGLGWRWLDGVGETLPTRRRAAAKPIATTKAVARPWLATFGRLVWQTWRQSWKTMLAALVLGPFLTASTGVIVGFVGNPSHTPSLLTALSLGFTPALYGALVFRADQRGQSYRFLAEHAGRPRTAWFARQLVWLAPLGFFGIIATACFISWSAYDLFYRGTWWSSDFIYARNTTADTLWADVILVAKTGLQATATLWLTGLLAYAVGQLASLAVRSDVLSGLVALVASVGVSAWGLLVGLGLLSPWWFVGPIAIGLLAASWLRSRGWLFERNHWGNWIGPAAVALAPIVLVVCSVPAARLAQLDDPVLLRQGYAGSYFPNEGGDLFTVAREARARHERGKDVADAYRRLQSEYEAGFNGRPLESPSQRLEKWYDEVIEQSRVDCRLPIDATEAPRSISYSLLLSVSDAASASGAAPDGHRKYQRLLAAWRIDAQQPSPWTGPLTLEGATADWAEHASAEEVLQLIDAIRKLERRAGEDVEQVKNAYLDALQVVRGESPPVFLHPRSGRPTTLDWLAYASLQMPGERKRAERALAVVASAQIDWLIASRQHATTDRFMHGGRATDSELVMETALSTYHESVANLPGDALWAPPQQRIEWLRHARTSPATWRGVSGAMENWSLRQVFFEELSRSAQRRLGQVRLALIAYHHREGAYPESLEALAPEYLFQHELRDPFCDKQLGYEPDGFENEVFNYQATRRLASRGVGLVWSHSPGGVEPQTIEMRIAFDKTGQPQGPAINRVDPVDRGGTAQTRTVTLIDAPNWYGVSYESVAPLPELDRDGVAPRGESPADDEKTSEGLDP